MLTLETFLGVIEGYVQRTGCTPTAFGKAAVNDPNFVGDLRGGRMPSLRLVNKVDEFIRAHPEGLPHESKEAAA